MFLDNELVWATAFSPTATGNNFSTNYTDTGPLASGMPTTPFTNLGRNLGAGEPLWLQILMTASVTSAGAATVEFQLVTDDNTSFSSPGVLASSGAIGKASLTAGTYVNIAFPDAKIFPYERYICCNANIGTAVLTGGTFRMYVVRSTQDNQAYAPGFRLDL